MNDMYVGQSPLERSYDEPEEDPLVTENNLLTARIAELTAEVARYKASNADLLKTLDVIGALSMARRFGGPDPMDLHELDRAVEIAIDMAHEAIDRNALKETAP